MKRTEEISTSLGLVVAFIYWVLCIRVYPNSLFGVDRIGNVGIYVVMIVTYFLAFFALEMLQHKLGFTVARKGVCISVNSVLMLITLTASTLAVRLYSPIWDDGIVSITVVLGTFLAAYLINTLNFTKNGQRTYSKMQRILVLTSAYLLLSLVWYKSASSCNLFFHTDLFSTGYNVHHSSAYIDQIYAVLYGIPYEGGITDQYGHYGLFFYPVLKVFGANIYVIAKIMGVISALTAVLFFYSVTKCVKNKLSVILLYVFMLWAGVIPVVYFVYWQSYPHRLIMPALIMAYITFIQSRETKILHYVIGTIICMLGVVWSSDSGIVCLVCWGMYVFAKYIREKGLKISRVFCGITLAITILGLPIVLSWGIVNLYNSLVGGQFMKLISYWGLDNKEYFDWLRMKLELFSSQHTFKVIFFLICVSQGFIGMIKGRRENVDRLILEMTAGFIGLGLSTYYIHHTSAGNWLTNIFFFICLTCIWDSEVFGGRIETARAYIEAEYSNAFIVSMKALASVLLVISLMEYTYYGSNVTLKYNSDAYNYGLFREEVREIQESIDDDTVGVGDGTSAIFMEMGRNRRTYKFNKEDLDYFENNLPDSFIMSDRLELPETVADRYVVTKEFELDQIKFSLYRLND